MSINMDKSGEVSEKKKRKKKRSHIQMAKKFARQRHYENDLDQDTYQYMLRILELTRAGFESPEEKIIFVQNVYQETIGHEIDYSRNQVGSRVIDSLLKYASLEAIQRLVEAFNSSLRQLSNDRFASHVLQKIILVCADRGNQISTSSSKTAVHDETKCSETKDTPDATIQVKVSEVKHYNDIVLKLSRYFLNNIEEFVFDTYANHVLRTVIECLAGLIEEPNDKISKKSMPSIANRRPVMQDYKDLLIQSCDRLYKWPQFLEFGQNEITSGLVQCILYSLKDIDSDLTETIIKKIINECFKAEEEQKLSNVFNTECSTRLLEACLIASTPKSYRSIYKKYFAGNLKCLCLAHGLNFSVQKLLDHAGTKEDLEEIFDEISEHFPQILKGGFTGILTSTGNACLKLQIKQGAFVNEMIKLLECSASTENQAHLVQCIVTLKTPSQLKVLQDQQLTFNLHGSLIIQAILHFNKPIKIVNSLLDMDSEKLSQLFGDPKGSRILDAFMDSKYVGEKSREKLFKKFHGIWAELAKNTHGSRCVDKIWIWAHMNQKLIIMGELAAAGESLRSTKSGRIISAKLNVPLFARSKKDWSESHDKGEKTKAMFANIMGKTSAK